MAVFHPFPQPKRARVDASFLDPRYPEWRRAVGLKPAHHPGVDINLAGTSGDQDLGYPVVAIADGVVVHAAFHKVWGNVVLIHHPELGVWSQYAHLLQMCVDEGQRVRAGWPVGSIGKGDPMAPFLAHLHFEIRTKELPADFWPGMNEKAIREAYVDPLVWLSSRMNNQLTLDVARLFVDGRFMGNIKRASVVGDKLYVKME